MRFVKIYSCIEIVPNFSFQLLSAFNRAEFQIQEIYMSVFNIINDDSGNMFTNKKKTYSKHQLFL